MNVQHAKRFSFVPVQVLVMHFVRPADSAHIRVARMREPFETLMDDHIMHEEVSKSIRHHAKSYSLQPVYTFQRAEKNTQKAGNSEDDEEGIVLFKKARFGIVMIFVQVPEKSMHYVFMGSPGDGLHDNESAKEYCYVNEPLHLSVL